MYSTGKIGGGWTQLNSSLFLRPPYPLSMLDGEHKANAEFRHDCVFTNSVSLRFHDTDVIYVMFRIKLILPNKIHLQNSPRSMGHIC